MLKNVLHPSLLLAELKITTKLQESNNSQEVT